MDFNSATHTAIISDLHLCEAEPVNLKYPLWKKFKTRAFFFDETFDAFVKHIEQKSNGAPVELILNGDIFDFDSVTKLPEAPDFRMNLLERKRGLFPRSERSLFKIRTILKDHAAFVDSLSQFIKRGNKVVFVIGNHDIELHWPDVRESIMQSLKLPKSVQPQVRFVEWFYISNKDTLIEHGNQYDPYCVCEDPLNPFILGYNFISLKLPFGNLACRYIMNGMGFFNPHVDSNYIMSIKEYVRIFLRYMARAQPGLVFTWFFGACVTLVHSFSDRLRSPMRNPMQFEEKVEDAAARSNAEPRMVRELRELFVAPASSQPWLLMRELWLDRALFIFIGLFILFEIFTTIRNVYDVSLYWMFIPVFLFLPFFLFYSRSITSQVSSYKEPDERILAVAGAITRTNRIVFGHTHRPRHEMIGPVEHLNSGCWSPAFLDIECTKPVDQKTFVWISPSTEGHRQAELLQFQDGQSQAVTFRGK